MTVPFTSEKNKIVHIDIDEDQFTARVSTPQGAEIGSIDFNLIEFPDEDRLELVWAHLEGQNGQYLHEGIGTECVKRMHEVTGYSIFAEEDDGSKKDDGSHLTNDAPNWIAKLRSLGLVS